MRTRLLLLASVVVGLGISGCSLGPAIDLGNNTEGKEGELEFTYGPRAFFDCLFGCPIDAPMLAGATVGVEVVGGDIDDHFRATTSDGSIAAVKYHESYSCASGSSSSAGETTRDVKSNEACKENEERRVLRIAGVTTKRAGSFDLRILDADGDLVDRVGLVAHDAASVQVFESGSPVPVSSPLTVAPGNSLELAATIVDAKGNALLTDGDGFSWSSADPEVAATTFDFAAGVSLVFDGDPTTTTLKGVGFGSTEVTFSTATAQTAIEVNVVGAD